MISLHLINVKYSIHTTKMECPICYEMMGSDNEHNLACNHKFHRTCISKWRQTAHTCPICRADICGNDLVLTRPGPDMAFLIARVKSLLQNYRDATDINEKEYKLECILRIVTRHHMEYDIRVMDALASHGINLPTA